MHEFTSWTGDALQSPLLSIYMQVGSIFLMWHKQSLCTTFDENKEILKVTHSFVFRRHQILLVWFHENCECPVV